MNTNMNMNYNIMEERRLYNVADVEKVVFIDFEKMLCIYWNIVY